MYLFEHIGSDSKVGRYEFGVELFDYLKLLDGQKKETFLDHQSNMMKSQITGSFYGSMYRGASMADGFERG